MKKINFDNELIKNAYIADYFIKTKTILDKFKSDQIVTMQWFQRKNNVVLCGIDYVIQMIQFYIKDLKKINIESLSDGDIINELEPVLKITGKYSDFAFLEGLIDGILARSSSIATNSRRLVEAANGKKIINMNDRSDFYLNQAIDGYSSYIGGIKSFVTISALNFIDDKSVPIPQGTMPHALIASFGGDTIAASHAFKSEFPNNDLVVLIDYNNDCVNEAINVVKEFGQALKAVRIDTSQALFDKTFSENEKDDIYRGVNPTLIKRVRLALDSNGGKNVKIIASSGFDAKKITWFESENAPVDIYGVGEAITAQKINFTGDIVLIDGKEESKVGRKNTKSKRLKNII